MQTAKNNFLDLPMEAANPETAGVIVAPFGFERSVTFGGGTKKGPEAIIKASRQVELFDEELWQETYKKTCIATLRAIKANSFLSARAKIGVMAGEILSAKKLPITLGGEHSITPFIMEAYRGNGYKDFSILQFDAHADLRDGYLGKKYSHASAMRRCLDFDGMNLVQIGIRNISNENDELNFWESERGKRVKTFFAKDKRKWKIDEIINALKNNVYITFDVDVFDSGIMPSTGTPEPGGLDWYEILDILRAVCKNRTVIGADFVELSPIKGFHAPDFLVAKLIYKTIGYITARPAPRKNAVG